MSLRDFQEYMEFVRDRLFPDGIIPAGTYLYHGSLSSQILDEHRVFPITYFGLEPSISVWKNIESLDEAVIRAQGVRGCHMLRELPDELEGDVFQSYVYVFQTTMDIPFTYVNDVECHPGTVCMNNRICLHPQVAYHGSPECYALTEPEDEKSDDEDEPSDDIYKYNMTLELTINNINLSENQYMVYQDTITIPAETTQRLYELKYSPNTETFPEICDLFEPYLNDDVYNEVNDINLLIDNFLGQGIDIYNHPDFHPNCEVYIY
jgi:hypothetical protein